MNQRSRLRRPTPNAQKLLTGAGLWTFSPCRSWTCPLLPHDEPTYSPRWRCPGQEAIKLAPITGRSRRRTISTEPSTLQDAETTTETTPTQSSLDEAHFKSLLRRHFESFRAVPALVKETRSGEDRAKRAFAGIQRIAEELSTFLDDHGARANSTFAPLAEYVSSVRGFATMGRHLSHVLPRLGRELPLPPAAATRLFPLEVQKTLGFVRNGLADLQACVQEELDRLLGMRSRPEESLADLPEKEPALVLPANLDEASVPEKERWIAEIASKLLAHKQILDRESSIATWDDAKAMRRFVLEVSDEQQVRFFSTRIHNLLSRYDTYIQGTGIEREDPELPRFRTFVVLSLHILAVMIELVHFYERHENEIRSERAKNRIADLIDKQVLLDRILNYSLNFLHVYMEEMVPLAEGLVERYTRRTVLRCVIPEGVTLHARPVSLITRIVDHYATPVKMTIGETTCYAGSILQLMMAVGANAQAREVSFEGDRRPLADLEALFAAGLGEGIRLAGVTGLPATLTRRTGDGDMWIGVISDTAGVLMPNVLDVFDGVDYIIHCGNIGDTQLLDELSHVAPVAGVIGGSGQTRRLPLPAHPLPQVVRRRHLRQPPHRRPDEPLARHQEGTRRARPPGGHVRWHRRGLQHPRRKPPLLQPGPLRQAPPSQPPQHRLLEIDGHSVRAEVVPLEDTATIGS